MQSNEVLERMFDLNKRMYKNIEKGEPAEAALFDDGEEGETPPQPVDMYQVGLVNRQQDAKKSYPNGTNPKLVQDAEAVLELLAPAYRKAKNDCELLKQRGDNQRAKMVQDQYTMEKFLPAVESLVHANTTDELLNASKVLEKLDEYAVVGQAGKGYTASYIRSAHADEIGNGEWAGRSDGRVRMSIQRIHSLLDRNQIRAAVGEANMIKEKIDKGEDIASQEDYDLINRVIIRSAR